MHLFRCLISSFTPLVQTALLRAHPPSPLILPRSPTTTFSAIPLYRTSDPQQNLSSSHLLLDDDCEGLNSGTRSRICLGCLVGALPLGTFLCLDVAVSKSIAALSMDFFVGSSWLFSPKDDTQPQPASGLFNSPRVALYPHSLMNLSYSGLRRPSNNRPRHG